MGQMDVNSLQTKGTKYKLPGCRLLKVSKIFLSGLVGNPVVFEPKDLNLAIPSRISLRAVCLPEE